MTPDFERLLRWYPPRWRARYGGEMTALLEDTYATARDVPLGQRLGLVRSGLAERARTAGLLGSSPPQEPSAGLRAGSVLILWGWALFLVATAVFTKVTDNWFNESAQAGRWVASSGFNVVGVAAAVGCALVAFAALLVLPAFVGLVRDGGWRSVQRPVLGAVISAVIAVVLLSIAVAWAHDLSAHDRNGGLPVYGAFFLVVSAAVVVAVACGAGAAVAVARRVDLSEQTLRLLGSLALGVTAAMSLVFAGMLAWWANEAVHAPAYLVATIGNGMPFTSSLVPPPLLAAGIFMVAGLALAATGTVRILRSWAPSRPTAT